jgi:hypothetical protein
MLNSLLRLRGWLLGLVISMVRFLLMQVCHEREYDYDGYEYDDYAQQVHDLPGNLDAFNAMYGTKLQGFRK